MRPSDHSLHISTRPAACPFCDSSAVGTLAKVISADTYWRCAQCGTGWTTPRHGAPAVKGIR
jgi:transposase-like protein